MTPFDDIPQEKFDALAEKIQPSMKELKINYVDIQNFKNIDSISTELGDWNIIGGFNGNGKSSFVEAIITAVMSNKFYGGKGGGITPAELVKKGEKEAVVRLGAQGKNVELVIERIFKQGTQMKPAGTTSLKATVNGQKIQQSDLDNLLNALTIDPLKLGNQTITEQVKEIKETIGLNTSEIDFKIKKQEEKTQETRMFYTQAKNVFEDFVSTGMPEKIEEQSLSKLLEDRKIFEEKAIKTSEYKNKLSRIEELKKQLAIEEEELNKIKQEGIEINKKITEMGLTTVDELDEKINDIEKNNEKAKKWKDYLSKQEHLNKCNDDFKKDSEKLEELRSERTQIIANSKIPEYMEISDELGILVDGVSYKLLNTARKIEVAIDLVLISGSPLRLIRIENGGELDTKTLEKVKQKIIDNNFQLFLERPIIDKYDTIIIDGGDVVDDKESFINKQ